MDQLAARATGAGSLSLEHAPMASLQARSLGRRSALLLVLAAAPLLALTLGLGLHEFYGQRQGQLDALARISREQATALDTAIKPVRDHIEALRRMAEDRLGGERPTAASPWRSLLRPPADRADGSTLRGVGLDAIAGTPLAARLGNVLATPELLMRPADAAQEVDAALDLFEPMRFAHAAVPYLRWSYYFSARADLIALYPFATTASLRGGGVYASTGDLIAAWLRYDVFLDGTPARDPGRATYWTKPYEDAAGAGWMVSHAAPVYGRTGFAGIVGTDLGLGYFAGVLARLHLPAGQLWLVDDAGQVLATPSADLARAGHAVRLEAELPRALRSIPLFELLRPAAGARHEAGHWLASARLDNAPFTLLYAVSDGALSGLVLPRVFPYAAAIGAVMALLLAAVLVLQQGFVRPALALVRMIQDEGDGGPLPSLPDVPASWRPWLEMLRRTFAERRAAADRLAASEARFKAAAQSLFDGLAIFDADDRLVFHNDTYPRHLPSSLRATLAAGKRWADWWREARALGPLFHPQMGEGYFERRLAERGSERCDRQHRLADGRWIRVREARMPDGGRVTLTSDISERVEATTALEESHRVREALLEAALDCFIAIDDEGRITGCNPAAERVFGYSRDTLLGRPLTETLVPAHLRAAHLNGLAHHLATGERRLIGRRIGTEVTALRRDGSEIPVEIVVAATHQDGRRGFVAYMRDLSEHKRVEAALRASEARFLAAAESIPDGLLILDADDRIVFHNRHYPALLPPALRDGVRPGLPFEQLLRDAEAREPIYHPDMGPAYLERRLAARREDRLDHEHRHADGRWVRVRESRMPDGGRVILTSEITAARAQREALAGQTRKLEAVLANTAEGVSIVDAAGRVVLVNEGFLAFYGFARELGAPGTPLAAFVRHRLAAGRLYPDERGDEDRETLVGRRVRELLAQGSTTFEERLPDGRTVLVRRERLPDGFLVSTYSDISELKRRERENALLAAAVEQAGDAVEIAGADHRLTYVNPAFTRLTGWSREEALGRTSAELLRGDGPRASDADPVAAALARGETWQGRLTGRHKDGREVFQEATFAPLRIDDEVLAPSHIIGVRRDIGERIRAEAALRESEELLRAVVDEQTELIARFDADFRLVFSNAANARLFARTPEAVIGADFFSTVPPPLRAGLRAQLLALTPEAPLCSGANEKTMPDGTTRWFEYVNRALFDGAGRCTGYLAVGRDVTEQYRVTAALEESEARLAALVENAPLVLHLKDREGRYLLANPETRRIFGIDPAEAIGKSPFDLFPPAEAAAIDRNHREVLASGRTVVHEEHQPSLAASGYEWSLVIRFPVRDARGEIAVIGGFALDITERKRAEAEIARQREALHQSEKLTALGSLLAGVAHELNNPLSIVTGYAEILRDLAPDATTRERAQEIFEAADRCAKIVRTFLAMARQRPPQLGPLSLNTVIEQALELAAYGLRTAGIETVTALAPDLPQVRGDSDQLHQVVLNLIINAQQALLPTAAPRRLAIRTFLRDASIIAEVADNGPGIAPEVSKRIFEPFFTTKPQGVGTGVGLSICHSIVAAHGGGIEADTSPDGGALLRVSLPAIVAETSSLFDHEPVPALAARGRILVVDDERSITSLVALSLEREGLAVETVNGGRAALARLARGGIDLVVSDLRMPDMDGAMLVAHLRATWPALAERLILMTGDVLEAGAATLARDTGLIVLEKPIDLAALRHEVRRLLAHGPRAEASDRSDRPRPVLGVPDA